MILTLGPWVAAWIEKYLVHGPGDYFGRPFELTAEQKGLLTRLYALDESGARRCRRGLIGRGKGWGKSEFAAAVAIAELAGPVRCAGFEDGRPVPVSVVSPDIPVAAASFEQADLVFATARAMISEGPLDQYCDVFDTEIQLKNKPGRMYRVAAVAGTNDGLRPTFFVGDETHEWRDRKKRVHLVIQNGLQKRAGAWGLEITTAGFDGDESVAEDAYRYGKQVESGEVDDPEFFFDWREASEELDLEDPDDRRQAVLDANPTAEERGIIGQVLARYHQIPSHEWVRYFGNRWTLSGQDWIAGSVWDARADDREPEGPIIVGFSASGHDRAALVGCTLDGHLFHIAHWESDAQVPAATVEATIAEVVNSHEVREIYVYPLVWQAEAEKWSERWPVVEMPVQSNKRMAEASATFYRAVNDSDQPLSHDAHPALRRHLQSVGIHESTGGTMITHRNASGPMDLARAAVLAYERTRIDEPSKEPFAAWI